MRKVLAATALTTGLAMAPTWNVVHAQDTSAESDDDNGKLGLLGLVGLVGLAGLAGLKRRDARNDNRRDTTAGGSVR